MLLVYTLVATDENGCSVTTTVEITEAEEMAITETHSFTLDTVFHVMEQQTAQLM